MYIPVPKIGNVLYTPNGYARQVHLNEGFLHAALAIPLNKGSIKGDPFELWYLERDVSRSGGKVAVVVSATVALARFVTFVPGRPD